jgi:dTDP-4-dehydrorhamnose 3,5-epimerase
MNRSTSSFARYNLAVTDTTTAEYFADKPEAAPRPLNSSLDLGKLSSTGFTSKDWREDLKIYIERELANVPSVP